MGVGVSGIGIAFVENILIYFASFRGPSSLEELVPYAAAVYVRRYIRLMLRIASITLVRLGI